MLPGETVSTGANITKCEFCNQFPIIGVYQSNAGYYVGYACCSPFSRESTYYRKREDAEKALKTGDFFRF